MKKLIIPFAIAIIALVSGCTAEENSTVIHDSLPVASDTETSTTVSATTFLQPTITDISQPQEITTESVSSSTPQETAASEPSDFTTSQVAVQTEVSTIVTESTTVVSTVDNPTENEDAETLIALRQQYEEKLPALNELISKTAEEKTMPVVYITTLNNERPRSKDVYVLSVIDVFNCNEQYRLTAEGGVRVRGNSTADGSEKPYRIKFDEKQNMLGLHDEMAFKSWVLLRSQWNLIPDFMGFSLAETIFDGEYYSSDCTYVNLYINGRYLGLYLLCEQNQATDGRVEVYEPKKDETHTDIGYFVEIDNYAGEEDDPYFTLDYNEIEFTDYVGTTRVFAADDYTIKSDINTEEQLQFIEKYIDGVFTIMYEAVENNKLLMFDNDYNLVSAEGKYSTPEEAVAAVIDIDSVVNTMILQELVHNYDVGAGSFFMAVDFSDSSKYKKLTFLAPWDFNWAYNDEASGRYYAGAFQEPVHDMYERSNVWLTVIMKADWFRDRLSDKWEELENGAILTATIKQVLNTAKSLENDLGDNSWRIDSAKDIVAFVRGRIQWLNTQWGRTAE